MHTNQMLSKMAHEVLSNADINAIARARGFTKHETASRSLFENFLLSEMGLEKAMGTLSEEEIACLHLLARKEQAVDVAFFARLYGQAPEGSYYSRTFTQKYKDTHKQVHKNLVRKGVLLVAMADVPAHIKKTKMERWRFRFPTQFWKFLPPLVKEPYRTDATHPPETLGDFRVDVLRTKVMEVVGIQDTSPLRSDKQYRVHLSNGELRIGTRVFRVGTLREWQRACWNSAVRLYGYNQDEIHPIEAVIYALSRLEPNAWVLPAQLKATLKIFSQDVKDSETEKVCQEGWRWGYLAKWTENDKVYYRKPANPGVYRQSALPTPDAYLKVTGDGVRADLYEIPYDALENLALVSTLEADDDGLVAVPNIVKLGRAAEGIRQHSVVKWLAANAPAYGEAVKTVESRWGRQIVHENLLVAKIANLSLQVQIERKFDDPQQLVRLPNGYVAFPRGFLPQIERLVNKSGYVIKRVQAK